VGLILSLVFPVLNLRQWSDKHAKNFCIFFFLPSLPLDQSLLQLTAELKNKKEKEEESSSFSLGWYNVFHPWTWKCLS